MSPAAKARRLVAQDGRCAYCRRAIAVESPDPLTLPCNQRKANRHAHDFMPGWKPYPYWNLET